MSNCFKIERQRISFEEAHVLLRKMANHFTPPLSELLDIQVFAHKLSNKAHFLLCRSEEEVVGFTAYYLNTAARQIYITLICVDATFQSQGIGGRMLDELSSLSADPNNHYDSIALEVNKANTKAHRFYIHHGFRAQEDRGEKILMVKRL